FTDIANETDSSLIVSNATLSEDGYLYRAVVMNDGECAINSDSALLTVCDFSTNIDTVSACDSYVWTVNGETYSQSGTFTEVVGCVTEVLELTIIESSADTTVVTACDSYVWSINGETYTESGEFTEEINCVTHVLQLSISESTFDTVTVSNCGSFMWEVNQQTYTESGLYTDTMNCDITFLDLTIVEIDTSITLTWLTLISNQSEATYQWLNCDDNFAPVSGETQQSFLPMDNGNYAVEITKDGCTEVSECIPYMLISTKDFDISENRILIYPNPATAKFFIDLKEIQSSGKIKIYNSVGQVVYRKNITEQAQMEVDFSGKSGVFFIQIELADGIISHHRIKIF
ncbi:MAG: T9SS C-terminal target domain-containing protein, partial [Chitinophagaceae bacterium]